VEHIGQKCRYKKTGICGSAFDESTQQMQQACHVAKVKALGDATLKGKQNKVTLYNVM